MMIVAHRGNLDGPTDKENHPDQLKTALAHGYHVECDVWWVDGKFVLGHDEPLYPTSAAFLGHNSVIAHAKSIEALSHLLAIENLGLRGHCFWHQNDDCVLTSRGFIWTLPNKPSTLRSIICHMEKPTGVEYNIAKAGGVCTDYPNEFRRIYLNSSRL